MLEGAYQLQTNYLAVITYFVIQSTVKMSFTGKIAIFLAVMLTVARSEYLDMQPSDPFPDNIQDSDPAEQTVVVLPQKVTMLLNEQEILTNDVTISANNPDETFKCIVAEAHPTPEIKWYLGDYGEEDISFSSTQDNFVNSTTQLITSISTLNHAFAPGSEGDNGKMISCHVMVHTVQIPAREIYLYVLYEADTAYLSITTGSTELVPGSMLELKCEAADANPRPTYSWKLDHRFLPDVGDVLKVYDVKTRDDGEYECVATNSQGSVISNKIDISVLALAFSSHSPASSTGSSGSVMKFTDTHTNIGNAYSTSTGIFTATASGTYFFQTHLVVSYPANGPVARILHNGNRVANLEHPGDSKWYTISNSVVLSLKSGDQVYVIYEGVDATYYTAYSYSTFSGYLIDT